MGHSNDAWTWVRHHLGWSNTSESWKERLIPLAFLLGFALVGWFFYLHPWLGLFGLIAWIGALIFASRQQQMKLLGPVLFYDVIRTARRGRYVLLRFLYACFLFYILANIYTISNMDRGNYSQARLAQIADAAFFSFMMVQISVVLLLTPAYVAGSIAEEKDRKTLEFMLATDLLNREIILSKYLARLGNLALLLLTGLPILSLLQLLGGIDPHLLLYGFAFTGLTMMSLAAVSILNSTQFGRPRDAIWITYLYIVVFYLLTWIGYWLARVVPNTFTAYPLWWGDYPLTIGDIIDFLGRGNVFVLMGLVGQSAMRGGLARDLPSFLYDYSLFHVGLTLVCLTYSIVRLRSIALKETARPALLKGRLAPKRPPVSRRPMLWKELYVEARARTNWPTRIIVALLVVCSFINPVTIELADWAITEFYYGLPGNLDISSARLDREMNIWGRIVGTMVACLSFLSLSVRASNGFSSERDRNTIDTLFTSPLTASEMVEGKFFGCLLRQKGVWIWMGLIYLFALIFGGLHVLALPALVLGWFVFGAFFTQLGLFNSIVCKTSLGATLLTLTEVLILGGGHWILWGTCACFFSWAGPGTAQSRELIENFLALLTGLTVPANLGILAFFNEDWYPARGGRNNEFWMFFNYCLFGLVMWGIANVVFWRSLLLPRLRQLANRQHRDE